MILNNIIIIMIINIMGKSIWSANRVSSKERKEVNSFCN